MVIRLRRTIDGECDLLVANGGSGEVIVPLDHLLHWRIDIENRLIICRPCQSIRNRYLREEIMIIIVIMIILNSISKKGKARKDGRVGGASTR